MRYAKKVLGYERGMFLGGLHMVGEIIIAVVSAVISSVVTWIFTRRQEARTERRQNAIVQREIFENRPEMSIVEYKDYLSRPGYGIKQKCDIELFVAQIDRVTVENNGKKGRKRKRAPGTEAAPEEQGSAASVFFSWRGNVPAEPLPGSDEEAIAGSADGIFQLPPSE